MAANPKTANQKTLVVVESPTKAKTLERYLGGSYAVKASYGHILDLPKNKLGRAINSSARCGCEALERRVLLSTINWTNKGSAGNDSDHFNLVFGGRAAAARSDVLAAFAYWSRAITDFKKLLARGA